MNTSMLKMPTDPCFAKLSNIFQICCAKLKALKSKWPQFFIIFFLKKTNLGLCNKVFCVKGVDKVSKIQHIHTSARVQHLEDLFWKHRYLKEKNILMMVMDNQVYNLLHRSLVFITQTVTATKKCLLVRNTHTECPPPLEFVKLTHENDLT